LTFNTAFHCRVDISILDKIIDKSPFSWAPFSKEEFKSTIANCNNSSTPGPDKLLWSHLKIILKNNKCLSNIISIADACIDLGYWPSHFKRSITVVIPKCCESKFLELDSGVILYRVYTRELNEELCTE